MLCFLSFLADFVLDLLPLMFLFVAGSAMLLYFLHSVLILKLTFHQSLQLGFLAFFLFDHRISFFK